MTKLKFYSKQCFCLPKCYLLTNYYKTYLLPVYDIFILIFQRPFDNKKLQKTIKGIIYFKQKRL